MVRQSLLTEHIVTGFNGDHQGTGYGVGLGVGGANHVLISLAALFITLSVISALIFACAEGGASKDSKTSAADGSNFHGAGCTAGCGAGCGGDCKDCYSLDLHHTQNNYWNSLSS